jgi:bifunctional non-homologous end joining protein LigD
MKQEFLTKIDGKTLKLTHLDKIYFPKEKITKGEVIDYYTKIAPYILPYLKNRPESLNRHPNGITGQSFFQKDMDHQPPPWAKTQKIYSESNEAYINYLICNDKATLIYMANLGCIEINPWFSTLKNLEKPDYAVLDLDPEAIGFEKVIEVALQAHKILEQLKIPNYCKTSGATGMHIYIPLGAKYTYDHAKDFTHLIAMLVNRKLPAITSLERSPKKRQKKIYLDFLQNRKGQTLAAPYSLRPKPGATVATPLEWKEVKKGLTPQNFTIKNIFSRLKQKGDLFKPVLGKGIDLQVALKRMSKLT